MTAASLSVPCVPRATVRLQIHSGFDLDSAANAVGYYAALGVSHYYVSPLQASRKGSTHGYDGINPAELDAARGGRPALQRLVKVLRAHGMGLILDIVPNHLSTSMENPWWFDVFEHGRASAHASAFAIDWDPPEAALHDRVLAPFLPDTPAAMVARGEISVAWDPAQARLMLDAAGERYPVRASSYASLLAGWIPEAHSFPDGMEVPAFTSAREQLAVDVRDSANLAALERALACVNADPGLLGTLIDAQHYALAHWRDAATRINWRRFFDISELVALRSEDEAVFDATHALVLDLYADGLIDGVRIDHVDGLADPGGYCRRLRARLEERTAERPDGAPRGPPWIVVEKILGPGETLREDWSIDGCTGYEFMDAAGALLHDDRGASTLDSAWSELGGRDYASIAAQARSEVLQASFVPDFERAARLAATALDVDVAAVREPLRALVLAYPRYRGYARPGRLDPADFAALDAASRKAQQSASAAVVRALVALYGGHSTAGDVGTSAIVAFQQLTPPLTARSLEDTAFYRYGRLLSRNEVGADPAQLSLSVDEFHAGNVHRAERWPGSLLATASHDHKRGEDTRMRIASLSAIAGDWAAFRRTWTGETAGLADDVPDAIDRSMLLQTLVGIWPCDREYALSAEFIARVHGWQRKAIRERKEHGSWADPDHAYEALALALSTALIRNDRFRKAMDELVASIERAAAVRSFSQIVLRCTSPGIPDLYQGTDGWDYSLVDPDNRAEVDLAVRLDTLPASTTDEELIEAWRDGRIKQRLLQRLLALRNRHPTVFAGSYRPVIVQGRSADDFVAYVRSDGETHVLVVVPIRPAFAAAEGFEIGQDLGDTYIEWPWRGVARDALSDRTRQMTSPMLVRQLFDRWPVAVFVSDSVVNVPVNRSPTCP